MAILHQTVLTTLARLIGNDSDTIHLESSNHKNVIPILHEEFLSVLESKWSSKEMLQTIRENVNKLTFLFILINVIIRIFSNIK